MASKLLYIFIHSYTCYIECYYFRENDAMDKNTNNSGKGNIFKSKLFPEKQY